MVKTLLALVGIAHFAFALPQTAQIVLAPTRTTTTFNYRHHLAGISPYFDSHGSGLDPAPPAGCTVGAATYYIRHSNIAANDDEWEETMESFLWKLGNKSDSIDWKRAEVKELGLEFLQKWESPIKPEEKDTGRGLEDLTESGRKDAKALGERLRKLYPHLLPSEEKGERQPFNVWTASASRDVGSAESFIAGLIPDHPQPTNLASPIRSDENSAQDAPRSWWSWLIDVLKKKKKKHEWHVKLIKVSTKEKDWGRSLTPHKVCDKFSKERGKTERDQWRDVYTKSVVERLSKALPELDLQGNDIVAMQQFCGYESVIRGSSPLCKVFTEEEMLDFEYYNDIYYYNMLGYAEQARFTRALGVPFLITATKKLLNLTALEYPSNRTYVDLSKPKLPSPTAAPNNTDTPQRLWTYFTHREEPPVVLTALGLFQDAEPLSPTSRDASRKWKTSEIIPFLGHVALERLQCTKQATGGRVNDDEEQQFIRVVVNSSPRPLDQCQDGPGGSCPARQWVDWIKERKGEVGDFETACKKDEEDSDDLEG